MARTGQVPLEEASDVPVSALGVFTSLGRDKRLDQLITSIPAQGLVPCVGDEPLELGRIDEARSALADFLRLAPDATVASTRAQVPLKGPGDLDRYIAALKRAGLRDN